MTNTILLLLCMTATAFDRGILALDINLLVAILAQFMCRLLVAVYFSIAYLFGMAIGAFINHHDLIPGMMTGCA